MKLPPRLKVHARDRARRLPNKTFWVTARASRSSPAGSTSSRAYPASYATAWSWPIWAVVCVDPPALVPVRVSVTDSAVPFLSSDSAAAGSFSVRTVLALGSALPFTGPRLNLFFPAFSLPVSFKVAARVHVTVTGSLPAFGPLAWTLSVVWLIKQAGGLSVNLATTVQVEPILT